MQVANAFLQEKGKKNGETFCLAAKREIFTCVIVKICGDASKCNEINPRRGIVSLQKGL